MEYVKVIVCILCCTLPLYGCQSRLLTVYKIDVQQGNALEAESVAKITLGMSKEQVRFVLGNPLIADSFHPDRWDYIYLFIPGYGEHQRRQLTVIFDRDEVIDIILGPDEVIDLIKYDIVTDDVTNTKQDETKKNGKKQLEKQEDENTEKEQKKLEKQAEELEQVQETNQDPTY